MHVLRIVALTVSFVFFCGNWAAKAAGDPSLAIDHSMGIARIGLQGETNRDYQLFGSDISLTNWNFLATLTLTNPSQSWFDSASTLNPNCFYRAVKIQNPETEYADDFRLIDHLGKSQSLYYQSNNATVKAIVLIFTGNGCTNVQQMVPVINALTNLRSQGILTWMIDANAGDNRSTIVAEATNLHIGVPILHDRAQIVARAYHATKTPEVICIDNIDKLDSWRIFYRGTIDDRIGSNAVATTQYYLTNALGSFLAGRVITPSQTKTAGCDITYNTIPPPSYSTDIAPILTNSCTRCHSPGNLGANKFSMTNYLSIAAKAPKIREEILAGRMPPWHADPYYPPCTNDISLTPTQAAALIQWIDNGAPQGTGPDILTNAPPPVDYPFAWPSSLGIPTMIITMQSNYVKATGTIDYIRFNMTYTGSNTWLRGAAALPGTVSAVHHILVTIPNGDAFLTGYAPGATLAAFPAGTGKYITNGTTLRFEMHYIANGTATNDISHLGLYTMAGPPTYPLIESAAYSLAIQIPPNTNYTQWVAETPTNTTKIRVYDFSPHLHTRGSSFKYEAIYPTGSTEVLLSVPFYVFHWQTAYRLTQPKDLPVGSKIRITATWDNSTQNDELMELNEDPTNPNNFQYSPNNTVYWGDQTWNEMFIGYFNYSVIP